MISEIIKHLLSEGENPAAPEPDDFDTDQAKETWAGPLSRGYVNLSDDIWSDDALLKRAFTWLTKTKIGPKFGSLPIGYYQQDQVEALKRLKDLADKKGASLKQVRWQKSKIQGRDASGKWITFAIAPPWHTPGMGLQEPVAEAEDDDDWKDLTLPPDEIIPNNPNWWRYRQGSKWRFLGDPDLEIYTSMQGEDIIHLNQIKVPLGSSGAENLADNVAEALLALVERAARGAIDRIVITLFLGDGYDEMRHAIDYVESTGKIANIHRSGMAVYASITDARGRWFREAVEDEDFGAEEAKEVHDPDNPEYTLAEIKQRAGSFFSRRNNRFHGTIKVYKYPGNFIVLKNKTSWPIYRWKRTYDRPDGDLFFVGHADDLDDAKRMIKTGDFRSRKERLRADMPRFNEALEDDEDFDPKEVYGKPRRVWAMRISPNGMLSIFFMGAKVGELKFRSAKGARTHAAWLLARLEKRHKTNPYRPNDYTDVWEWFDQFPLEENLEDDADEDDVREIFGRTDAQILRQTQYLQLIKTSEGKFFLEVTFDAHPRRAELSERDVRELMSLNDTSFNSAAVMDFGVGVYQGLGEEEDNGG